MSSSSRPLLSRNSPSDTSPSERSPSHRSRHVLGSASRMLRSTISCATWSRWKLQPAGRNGKSSRTCFSTSARDPPRSARRRRSKRNSFRCVPTKSRTVHALFPKVFRSPRPSCWRNRVGLSVGRSNRSVSTLGMSMPSLKRSTVKTALNLPSDSSRSASSLRSSQRLAAGKCDRRQAELGGNAAP